MEKYLVTFTDVDETDARLLDREKLAQFLRDNIAEEHYSGGGYRIDAVYRFDGGDKLTLLDLQCRWHRSDPDEFITYSYVVAEPGDDPARKDIVEFTVTIDGRA